MSGPTAIVAVAMACLAALGCSVGDVAGVQSAAAVSEDWSAGTATHGIAIDGAQRTFLLHVPDASSAARALPLVIVLHGSSGDAESIRESSQMDVLSDARGFLVAYPNGSEGGFGLYPSDWNAGTCCGASFREGVDDLAFISALIARVESQIPVDRTRIYVAGFSDGGRMAYHVACQLAPTIAAIAVVSGSLVDDQCAPDAGVPVLAIHGTADDQVAYDEQAATSVPGGMPEMASDLPSSIQFWIAADGCGSGTVAQVAGDVVRTTFDSCAGGNVVFFTIDGGSHGWPGEPGADPLMSEIKASELIADFFGSQARRGF